MLRIAPLVIAYSLWGMFVISWGMYARFTGVADTIATPDVRSSGRASRWGAGGRGERLHGLLIAFGLAMMVVAPVTRRAGTMWVSLPLVDWAMLLVIAAGIGLCWWARLHLGRFWSPNVTRKEEHRIVDTGPYRLVRHPIYSGFILIYLGLAIVCATALALVAVALMTIGLWLKARVEERFLIEQLGASVYRAYMARTPMLVPRLVRGARAA